MTTKTDKAVVLLITAEIENTDANVQTIVTWIKPVLRFEPASVTRLDDGSGLLTMTIGPAYRVHNNQSAEVIFSWLRLNVSMYAGHDVETTLSGLHAKIAKRKVERLYKAARK